MFQLYTRIGCALALLAGTQAAQADVLNFDDLHGLQFFTTNYHAFQFGTNHIDDTAWFHTGTATVDDDGSSVISM